MRPRPVTVPIVVFALFAAGCCGEHAGGDDSASTVPSSASLEGVTAETMAATARTEGFTVREETTEREEMPGATVCRLTLDHPSKGTAFVDLYDLSEAEASPAKPAVEIGKNKTVYVRAVGASSALVLTDMLRHHSLDQLDRASIEDFLREQGWDLGDSSRFKDDISGQRIVDVAARKGSDDVVVVLLNYARVAAGVEQSAMLADGSRLLFVDMEKRRWSKALLAKLAGSARTPVDR